MAVSRLLSAACVAATLFLAGCAPEQPIAASVGYQPQLIAFLFGGPVHFSANMFAASWAVSTKLRANSVISAPPQATVAPGKTINAPVQSTQPNPLPNSQQQKNQQLIDAVEQAYQGGMRNYRAGHLEAAKASFDYAVDQMLTSGSDLKNDPQLSAEFDRIVDAVNTLEMEAIKQGNGFEPHIESAPVDVANDVTFAPDPNLTAQVRAELQTTQSDLPLVLNDYVASYINFFANTRSGHATIVHSLTRAGRYKAMIQRILAEEGVPQDLIYQAVAESGFQPQIRNGRSGAGGMWQFMPGDAFAPPRSAWYDQRFDPEQSTRAYAKYIKYLHNQLGDWYLAMAAYDWGAGNVQRAVQRTGYADFWELYRRNVLPQETKNYVPIILAATIMAKNPKQYGLDTIVFDPPLASDTVTTNYSVDLRLVADIVEAPLQEIVALNPSLLRMVTPPEDSFALHVPPGTKDIYAKRIEEIPVERRRSWRFHKVAPGETLDDIARTYHVSVTEIAFVNQLGNAPDVAGTDSLIIPAAAVASSSVAHSTRYVTRKGDTLVTVADRFNVSVDDLRNWNHLKGSAITPGHSLYVSAPARVGSPREYRAGTTKHSTSSSQSSHTKSTASTKSAKASPAATSRPKTKHPSTR
jgi:membrane-bound lytic murein transglycosylase D